MNKKSFSTFLDKDEIEQPKIKVGWEPIKLNEEKKPEFVKKSNLKSLREVFESDFAVNKKIEEVTIEEEKLLEQIPQLVEEFKKEIKQAKEIKEEVKEEIFEQIVEEIEVEKTVIDKAAEYITKEAKLKEESYQQPNPPSADKNFNDLVKKVKYLEQWLGKVSLAGPGSGEVEFRKLDDVDKASFANRDTHKLLRYKPNANPAYDTVFFDFLSGDQGPIYSLKFDESGYTSNANVAAGLVAWNSIEDCLNITQADGSTLQVGLENYIRVYNNTANTFANGTFIEFTGVDAEGDAPTFRAYINDANAQPLYNIGVLTTDVASNTHGRATVLGLVRDLDTTGNAVGEVWSAGDILWASPSYPGNYTKNKPTAPNVALSVAAVTVADATNGIILVRPTIWPRLYYGDFYSTLSQTAPSPNQDVRVAISNTLISSGFTLSGNTIIAQNSGLYKFQSRLQLTSDSANQKSIIVWYKRNGVNIPYSAVRQSVAENGGYRTISNFQVISMNASDNVSVHFAVTDTTLKIDSPAVFDGAPNIPAIQLSVTEAAL